MGEIEVATKLLVNDAEEDEVRTDPSFAPFNIVEDDFSFAKYYFIANSWFSFVQIRTHRTLITSV